jgi:hypothetical protein
MITLEKINDRNRVFWEVQTDLLLKRVSDPILYEIAGAEMSSEQRRSVPVYCRKNLDTLMEDAERIRTRLYKLFVAERARKGGSAQKADALTHFLRRLVARKRWIAVPEVLQRLKEHREFQVNSEEIAFTASNGHQKSVPISALKDRLSRTKKGTNSQ